MKRRQLSIIVLLALGLLILIWNPPPKKDYIKNQGLIFGTSYHIIYHSPEAKDYGVELRKHLMDVVDNSLSTFNEQSIISKINNNEEHLTDSAFEDVFFKAQEISKITGGAFDLTVAPLVNRWGFGYNQKSEELPDSEEIVSLLQLVGYQKITLENHIVVKDDSSILLDASAIAKGYAVDVAAEYLMKKGISDYMVEIGGEIRVGGVNSSGNKWRVGIDRPIDDPAAQVRVLDTVLHITDRAIATSGNYRQFYVKEGKRYSHTINPLTGYPVDHSLLSATVIAEDCMTADALATAFMVMGAKEGLRVAAEFDGVEVFFIIDNEGNNEELFSDGMEEYLSE